MITRGTKRIIKDIIIKNQVFERYELLDLVCEDLVNRYEGDQVGYQLSRMKLEKTSQVLDAIDYVLETSKF